MTKSAIPAIFDGLFDSVEPTSDAVTMVFIFGHKLSIVSSTTCRRCTRVPVAMSSSVHFFFDSTTPSSRRRTRIAGFQSKHRAKKVVDPPTRIQHDSHTQGILPPDNSHSCRVVRTTDVEHLPILFLSWETMSDQESGYRLLHRSHWRSVWPTCRG